MHVAGLLLALVAAHAACGMHNLTAFLQHRQKRWLIYQNSGSMRFSIGPSMPIPLEDPISWRSLVLSFTLQGGQYSLPTTPIWPWDKWESNFARSQQQMRNNIERTSAQAGAEQRYADDARLLVYTMLEQYLGRQQLQHWPAPDSAKVTELGRQCLLRSICENAQVQQHLGIFSEILNIVLSPGKADLHADYANAEQAGRAGVNCLLVYDKCPRSVNILDEWLIVDVD